MFSIEGKSIFISQFNKYLDITLIWVILYFKFKLYIFLFIPAISLGVAAWLFLLCYYNELMQLCPCEICQKKDYDVFLRHKYAPRLSIEDQYWLSQKINNETILETKTRILKEREDHYNSKLQFKH